MPGYDRHESLPVLLILFQTSSSKMNLFIFLINFRNGLELPTSCHFWPIYKIMKDEDTSSLKKGTGESECIMECSTYFNGKMAPDDLNINELPENEITEWYVILEIRIKGQRIGQKSEWKDSSYHLTLLLSQLAVN